MKPDEIFIAARVDFATSSLFRNAQGVLHEEITLMKKDSIPMAVIAAFLAASQLAFSLPTTDARTVPARDSQPADPSNRDETPDPPEAERR